MTSGTRADDAVTTDQRRPHVLVVHCHDLGRFLGCYGIGTLRTPHIDAWARDAVVCEAAFSAAPHCSPARAALFTGRYPHATGVLGLTSPSFGWDLHPDELHLSQRLHRVGYRTELIGVHHESRTGSTERIRRRLEFDRVDPGGMAVSVADRAIARLRELQGGSSPWYLQVGFTEPHRVARPEDDGDHLGFLPPGVAADDAFGISVPSYLRDEATARQEMAELQGAVHHVDHQIGRVVAEVEQLGLARDTIVVLTTDHGLALPGAKGTLYDPGIEVAMIMRHPASGWCGGRRTSALASHVDLVPTILTAAGLDAGPELHGEDLGPVLSGRAGDTEREEVFAELTFHAYYDPRRCLRTRQHKVIANFATGPRIHDTTQSWRPRSRPAFPAREPRAARNDELECYDLAEDPDEVDNLAGRSTGGTPLHLQTALVQRLGAWMLRTRDPLAAGPVAAPVDLRARHRLGLPSF